MSSSSSSSSSARQTKVAFQGVPGAYSELCIREFFGDLTRAGKAGGKGPAVVPLPCATFDLAFEALIKGRADLAMLPIENSLGGTIYRNIDLLLRCPVHVIGEHNFRVRHCLLALPGTKKAEVKTVISHPQALAQCEEYIRRLGATAQNELDTAGSAEMIQKQKLRGFAAVASSLAAETYGLEKLDEGIEDNSNNYTRFLCLQSIGDRPAVQLPFSLSLPRPEGTAMKTSIVFCLNGARRPGKLFKALSTFALRDISITKIESRPMKETQSVIRDARRPLYYDFVTLGSSGTLAGDDASAAKSRAKFQYVFYVDILAGIEEKQTVNALRHLGEVCSFLRVLGSYPESREMAAVVSAGETKESHENAQEKKKNNNKKGALRILVVGFGVFGQFLAKTYVRQGHVVFACSRSDYTSLAGTMGVNYFTMDKAKEFFATGGLDCIVLSMSINSFERVVKSLPWASLKTNTLVVDVLSVKIHPKTILLSELPFHLDILCTHPMFGPESGAKGWAGLPFMFERVRVRNRETCGKFVNTFGGEGCLMYEMTCEMHDSYAASSQFITHTTGRILSKLNIKSTPINTRGFESLLKLVETTCKDSFDLYEGLYKHNVHSREQLTHLRSAFDEIERILVSSEDRKKQEGGAQGAPENSDPSQREVNPNVASMKPSATIQIHALATKLKEEGQEIVSLAVGEPNDTKCPAPILEAAHKALADGRTYYTSSVGMLELRKEICAKLLRDNQLKYTPDCIVCSNGAKQSLMQLITAVASANDEVIVPAPYWTSYPEMCRLVGCKPVILPTEAKENYLVSPQQLEDAITPKTRVVILCSPSNPTGSVYPQSRLEGIAKVLRRHPRVLVLSDEIYEYITYDEDTPHFSIATLPDMYERTAVVNGFSKGFAMTGFRLGYIAAPPRLAKLCAKVQGQITSCPSSISQCAGVAALKMGMGPVEAMLKDFRKKRQFVMDSLAQMPDIECPMPLGAFYAFPRISAYYGKATPEGGKISNSTEFCKYLLSKYKVALVPGAGFGDDRCIRISYAGDMNDLRKAMSRLGECLKSLK